MIPISFDHTASLFPNPSDAFLIPRGIQFAGPKREFGLKIDSLLVCGGKAGFGGTVGVKTHVVQTPLFEDSENSPPFLHIHRGVTGQWERTPFVGSAEKDWEIVEGDAHPRAGDFAKSER
jgi:hypothetical protein